MTERRRTSLDLLRDTARLARAVGDAGLAVDLFDAAACAAVGGYARWAAANGVRVPIELARATSRDPRELPRFAIATAAVAGDQDAAQALLARAWDADARRLSHWPSAEALFAWMRAHAVALAWTPVSMDDAQAGLLGALDAWRELLAVPIPLRVLEPMPPLLTRPIDKLAFGAGDGTSIPMRDAGFAVDRLILDRDALAVACVALPPPARSPYYRTYAEGLFERGHVERAYELMQTSLAEAPDSDSHSALLRYGLAHPQVSDRQLFAENRRWAALYAGEERLVGRRFGNDRSPGRPLRVGYICDYMHTTLAQHSLLPIIETHDPAQVAVHYYNHGVECPPVRAAVASYNDVRGTSDDALFDLIAAHGIDILVDLNGRLRVANRYEVLCRKPAPILVNWYNLLASTGLRAFDFLIADEVSLPLAKADVCTEEIMYLDCQAAGTWRLPDEPRVAPLPCLTGRPFTFACFGGAFKVNRYVLDLWCRLLQETPGTVLYLKNLSFYTPSAKAEVEDFFVRRGIAPERLRLEHGSEFHQMRGLYAWVDLALDTFPYNNGSTTVNALWQGVPTLTLANGEWRGSTGAALMTIDAGLPEFVVHSPDEYIARAQHYVAHPQELAAIRAGLRARLLQSGHFDVPRFTRDLEAVYRRMWHRYLARSEN